MDAGRGAPYARRPLAPLEPRRTLYVIEAAGRYFLVGAGDGGAPATRAELEAASVRGAAREVPMQRSFLEVLADRLRPHPASATPEPPPGHAAATAQPER